MIVAFCDRCGDRIDSDVAAGCRVLTGKREVSFHLCGLHQVEMRAWLDEYLSAHTPRKVS